MTACGGDIGDHQDREILLVPAADHEVAHDGLQLREQCDAQGPDAHPRAGGELEIFADAPVEEKARTEIVRVERLDPVAHFVVTVFVERIAGEIVAVQIARRDARPAQPDLQLGAGRNEFDLDARQRHADVAAHVRVPIRKRGRWGRFGGAEAARHHDLFAALLHGQPPHVFEHGSGERRTGIPHHLEALEERAAQCGIFIQNVGQFLIAARHVEVHRGGDVAQVAQRFREFDRRRFTVVDVERAAVVEHHVEDLVRAGRVIPRRPIQHHHFFGEKRKRLEVHLLVRA